MKLTRDAKLLIFLLVLLVAIMVAASMGKQAKLPPLVSISSAPDGAKALKLWLPELGFKVNENLVSEFSPPSGVDTILMLEPAAVIASDWEQIDTWVNEGGTLIVAGAGGGMSVAATHFDFSTVYSLDGIQESAQNSPLASSPELTSAVNVNTDTLLTSKRSDYVIHLANKDGLIAVSFAQGKGRVVLCTSAHIFTNRGLKEDANAAFVLNLLALAEPKSTVWFDEWHHGLRALASEEQIIGPDQWLRKTPIGNAFIFILAAVVIGLFMQGRAFGRPVPLPQEIRRRTVMEHVTAIANLNRRAGHRADVMRQYHAQVKRHLGRRYRIDPSLHDTEYVATLKKFNPSLDDEKLLKLLHGLSQPDTSEAEMVKLAAQSAEWIKE